jgi:hypothetical protein
LPAAADVSKSTFFPITPAPPQLVIGYAMAGESHDLTLAVAIAGRLAPQAGRGCAKRRQKRCSRCASGALTAIARCRRGHGPVSCRARPQWIYAGCIR